jgi:hypothetical protein
VIAIVDLALIIDPLKKLALAGIRSRESACGD